MDVYPIVSIAVAGTALIASAGAVAQQAPSGPARLEYFGKSVRGVPVAPAVKVGKFVFVSGTPGFDSAGKLAVGDFPLR